LTTEYKCARLLLTTTKEDLQMNTKILATKEQLLEEIYEIMDMVNNLPDSPEASDLYSYINQLTLAVAIEED
jgi:aminopeptidase C